MYKGGQTGCRQCHVAGAGDISDIHAVYDTVKDADKLCQHTGNCDPDDELFYVVTAEIIFSSHNKILLMPGIYKRMHRIGDVCGHCSVRIAGKY